MMTGRCWPSVALILVFALAGCGSSSNDVSADAASPERGNQAASPSPSGAGAAGPDARSNATAGTNAAGVSLLRAKPAPSALFNAAYQRVEDQWEPVLFLCDGVGGDRIKVVTTPNAKGLSTLWTYRKPDFRTTRETVRLGDDDPGAGQIMRAIERPDGSAFGSVHSINPGMLGDADTTTLPTLSGITDKAESTQCRWEPRGRVLLVDGKRSVLVIADEGGSYTYRSFDYATPGKIVDVGGGATSAPSTVVHGGRLVPADPGHEVYEFRKAPWTYRVSASADNTAPGARLTVLRDGKPVQTSVAAAYQMAAKRIE